MSDSVRPHRQQPTRLPRPQDSPGKNTGVGCHFLLQCLKVKSEREIAQSCPTLSDPGTAAYQASPSMGCSRQEYWSGLPLPSPFSGRILSKFCFITEMYVVLILRKWKWSCSVGVWLCNPMDCNHGIFQAKVLQWVSISFSRETMLWLMLKVDDVPWLFFF